jgi:hypothetical protein
LQRESRARQFHYGMLFFLVPRNVQGVVSVVSGFWIRAGPHNAWLTGITEGSRLISISIQGRKGDLGRQEPNSGEDSGQAADCRTELGC